MENIENNKQFKRNGMFVLLFTILSQVAAIVLFIMNISGYSPNGILAIVYIVYFVASMFFYGGLKIIKPNEALVLTLFGKFYGCIDKEGFYFVNPFVSAVCPRDEKDTGVQGIGLDSNGMNITLPQAPKNKVSLKVTTLNNPKQKVNDKNGNPIEIGVVVIWKVVDPIKAVFNVDNYRQFISIQSDSSIRSVARSYVYDGDDGENSLTGSTKQISDKLQEIIQAAVVDGGIEIIDAKIAHLAYSPEIASAMLQRQQADAIIAARQKIVEGAVGMVEQALTQLSEREVVELDDERKAQMVSNLLVVLCANKEAQPIVNSGSIY